MGWDRNKRKIRGRGAQFTSGVTVDDGGFTATKGGITVSSGGATVTKGGVTVSSGGVTVAKGGLTVSSGAFRMPYLAVLTTGTALTNSGVSHLTGTSDNNYSLALPVAGCIKVICSGNSTKAFDVTCATKSYFQHSGGGSTLSARKLTMNGSNEGVILVGLSTVRWFIASNMNSVSVGGT